MGSSNTETDIALLVHVTYGTDRSVEGLPVEISRSVLAVVFPEPADGKSPAVAEKVHLAFHGRAVAEPVEFDAYTMLCEVTDGIVRLRMQITSKIESALRRLPFRRATYRASIPASGTLTVETSAGDGRHAQRAELRDISLGGLSFDVPKEEDRHFAVKTPLSLAFHLRPGEETRLVGFVRYRAAEVGAVRYGVQFDWGSAENRTQIRERLNAYVFANQIATLRLLNQV